MARDNHQRRGPVISEPVAYRVDPPVGVVRGARGGQGLPVRITDWSRLRIVGGVIHYRLYQQDGTSQPMTCPDTVENRNFVSWVQIHDRAVGSPAWKPLA